jgi:hypothetical protein
MFCYQAGSFGDGFNTHFVRTDSENGSYSRIGKKYMRQNGQTRLIVLCLFISFCTLVRIITRRKGLEHITDVPDLSDLRSPILILRTLALSGRQGDWVAQQRTDGGLSTQRACSKCRCFSDKARELRITCSRTCQRRACSVIKSFEQVI